MQIELELHVPDEEVALLLPSLCLPQPMEVTKHHGCLEKSSQVCTTFRDTSLIEKHIVSRNLVIIPTVSSSVAPGLPFTSAC